MLKHKTSPCTNNGARVVRMIVATACRVHAFQVVEAEFADVRRPITEAIRADVWAATDGDDPRRMRLQVRLGRLAVGSRTEHVTHLGDAAV